MILRTYLWYFINTNQLLPCMGIRIFNWESLCPPPTSALFSLSSSALILRIVWQKLYRVESFVCLPFDLLSHRLCRMALFLLSDRV